MDNINASSVEAVAQLAEQKVKVERYGDIDYIITAKGASPIFHDPRPGVIEVDNLDALCSYFQYDPEELIKKHGAIVIIHGYDCVSLSTGIYGPEGVRTRLIRAQSKTECFDFTFSRDLESIIIGLQSCFVRTDQTQELIDFLSLVSIDNGASFQDNGISQSVTVRNKTTGKKKWANAPGSLELTPFRTFLELDQPESLFVFRLQQHGGEVKVTLHGADGGAWKLEAVKRIRKYLKKQLPEDVMIL